MRVRLRVFALPALTAGLLAGCNQGQLQGPSLSTPDPFGNMKRSAVCQVASPQAGPNGDQTTTMTVRSDDGMCGLTVSQPGGGSYASFGVLPSPEHGKAFLYNHDGLTHITYTPTLGYAGKDTFGVILIPTSDQTGAQKRQKLTITATADATGVVIPTPAVAAPTPSKSKAAPSKRRTTKKHG
ncbi:hypothetical protein ANI02nite_29540 [Acetobacter nitrogenifigens DSM 23921 = NBRC 105050]|uniref:Lipoprotein n=1 Tax=Acetobacter nitrogenifigens DSM 23921 = NBRC 105050 TaxID=1120919 RepID=A0A511XDN1_9PROT|nr:hypothetical protein ANI02nite_29540 [Acetobacter nitrogenifigens DSM 23921 = NBRC 105050]